MKPHIKLNFTDFWPGFNKFDNYFCNILKSDYEIEISDEPDFVICSCFGQDYKKFTCIRIFFTGENIRPNFKRYDYAFSFDYIDDPNNYRLPLYAFYFSYELERKDHIDFHQILAQKTGFCNFVYSNARAKKRIKFFRKLSKYKQVDAGGKCLNNIGGKIGSSVTDKLEFIKKYKFTIAFESSSYPGYTTEKIVEPFLTHSLPIYWGNPLVHLDFNTKSFLNAHEFANEAALIKKIIEIDNDDGLYLEYLKETCFNNNQVNNFVKRENVLKQFSYIFTSSKIPIAKARKKILFY